MTNDKGDIFEWKSFLLNLTQYSKKKKGFLNELRRLIITICLFLIMQLIFIFIDGTFLEPNLNRMGNFASGIAKNMFFEQWLILYDNSIFKLITAIAILHIVYILIKTVIIGLKEKNTKFS
ncbi:hypothetical protein J416_12492 [Gracilibacillus halophilus YIM-C55.5]|uniref:Uncharacterized protein n=1 Tax=Gracilibacillus halophilus YIM-C55.5 TaxID=1308866 RepID=N4WNQ2_9BACI|nr:YfzA family protein [Gracilibacillus halophilus]ENH96100.1 hypothetical protein J416_12492 [Gracilibacillus halophilus YIM-C55.5]